MHAAAAAGGAAAAVPPRPPAAASPPDGSSSRPPPDQGHNSLPFPLQFFNSSILSFASPLPSLPPLYQCSSFLFQNPPLSRPSLFLSICLIHAKFMQFPTSSLLFLCIFLSQAVVGRPHPRRCHLMAPGFLALLLTPHCECSIWDLTILRT